MSLELWAQVCGACAAVLGIFAYQQRGERTFIFYLAAGAGLWALHFLMLGAITAALMNVITVVRNLLAANLKSAHSRTVGYVFVIGYLSAGAATWTTVWDVLPTIAVCVGSVSLFFFKGLLLRTGLLTGGVLWFIFNAHVGSVPGMVVMFVESISNSFYIGKTLLKRHRAKRNGSHRPE